jgi:probable HAF family extracellular repeat protein
MEQSMNTELRTSTLCGHAHSMSRAVAGALLLAAGVAALAPAESARAQVLTHLGFLPDGNESQGLGMSADGSVIVGAAEYGYRAFRWSSAGGMQELLPGTYQSAAYAVSGDGAVIVGEYDATGTGLIAFRWTQAGGVQDLPIPAGWTYSGARSVNADGSVISGYGNGPDGFRAVVWTNAGGGFTMHELGMLPTNCGSNAWSEGYGGVSADGTVICGDSTVGPFCEQHAYRWTSDGSGVGTLQDLGTLEAWGTSKALGLSADGAVVVGRSFGQPDSTNAFRWTAATGMQDIGTPVSGAGDESGALAANADGSVVVVYSYDNYNQLYHPFMWTQSTGTLDLTAILGAQGINVTEWQPSIAAAVSADGLILTGTAFDWNTYQYEAWVADLHQATNPAGTGNATPGHMRAGGPTLLTVGVFPAMNPPSTGLTVTADLSTIGGSGAQTFYNDGTHGDVTAGDNIFSYLYSVPAATAPADYALPFTVRDAQIRSTAGTIPLSIHIPPVATDLGARTCESDLAIPVTLSSATDVRWYRIGLPAVTATAGFVDIWTTEPDMRDTLIAVYNDNGDIVGFDNDDCDARQAAISFGLISPTRPAIGDGQVFDGRDGGLAAAIYWVGVMNYGANFSAHGWGASSYSNGPDRTCTLHFHIDAGSVCHCGSADFNCDGDVGTDADIEAFFACIAGTCPPAPCTSSADFNADGDVGTDGDIEAFFRVLGGGTC